MFRYAGMPFQQRKPLFISLPEIAPQYYLCPRYGFYLYNARARDFSALVVVKPWLSGGH
jgi:hypothetical protein